MPLLSADELASMRDEQNATLPDTCTIQTKTTTNVKGSWSDAYANTYTQVACRLAGVNVAAVEKEFGAAVAAIVSHVLTVAYDQAIAATDRVVMGGITYEVEACSNTNASWRTARRAYLKLAG